MIESLIIEYLNSEDVPAYGERPEVEPAKPYLLVEKTGSSEENHIPTATIAVQSWAQSLAKAAKLNEDVKEAMKHITDLNAVSSCRLNSDYNFTSTALKAYRYQAVFTVTYYEEET